MTEELFFEVTVQVAVLKEHIDNVAVLEHYIKNQIEGGPVTAGVLDIWGSELDEEDL